MSESSICSFCDQAAGTLFVHGHYQCLACGSVQIPCCEGAPADGGSSTAADSPSALQEVLHRRLGVRRQAVEPRDRKVPGPNDEWELRAAENDPPGASLYEPAGY